MNHVFSVTPADLVVAVTMLMAELFFLYYAKLGQGFWRRVLAFVLGCITAGVWVTIGAGLIMYGLR